MISLSLETGQPVGTGILRAQGSITFALVSFGLSTWGCICQVLGKCPLHLGSSVAARIIYI